MKIPRRAILGVISAALITAVPGCGLLSGEDNTPAPNANTGSAGVEKSKITLGIMPIVDVAPTHIAIQKGYFKAEGLDVELKAIQGGAAGIPGLVNGELDMTFGNWVSFMAAQAKGAADIKLVADGYRGKPGMFPVVAPPDSPVKTAKDLAGKKIAVNTRANVTELAVRAALTAQGVDANSVQFTEMPFPDMQSAMQRKNVDAALLVEPFITRAEQQLKTVTVLDTITGDADHLAIGGYATSAKFAAANPKTVAAFQRALVKAHGDAAADRKAVESVVTGYAKVEPGVAAALKLGEFPTSIDVDNLKKLVALMKANGMLDGDVDPSKLMLPATS